MNTKSATLVAITKTFPPETVVEAYRQGIRHFGENRVEEAKEKIARTRKKCPDAVWHMVGHVQGRKARQVAYLFDWVDSVDSVKLAWRLDRFAHEAGKKLNVLLQVNIAGERTKFGLDLNEVLSADREIASLRNIRILGLMVMPPRVTNPEDNREIFQEAKKLFDKNTHWEHLSMGTSQDYEVAIEEGATMVRLGEAIFGERVYK